MKTARQISARQISALRKALKAKANCTVHHVIPKGTNTEVLLIRPTTKTVKPYKIRPIPVKIANKLAKTKAKKSIDTTVVIKPVDDVICTDGLHIPKDCMYIPGFFKENIEDGYYIINPNGYTKEQLSTELPCEDIDYIEAGIKIPVNFGVGVELIHKGERLIYARGGQSWRAKPTVTLEIYTWRGISCGALHYYGKLNICFPEATYKGNKEKENYTTSTYIPMYHRHEIELTQVLEEWEIKKYPENYKFNEAGQRHRGFYTRKQVTDYGKQVFEQIFEKGWIYRVEEH